MTVSTCPAAVYQPDDQGPIAPSAVAISGQIDLPDGSKGDFPVPRALRTEEIPAIAQQFATGARNALAAGFDGVEVSRRPPCGAHVIVVANWCEVRTAPIDMRLMLIAMYLHF
jgi:NADH:flavin oxidoreductase / NADH oxidase family